MTALVVFLTPRAARHVQTARAWWRENRPAAPDLFDQELRAVLSVVATAPTLGASAWDARVPGVRRILLRRSRYHAYYRVNASAGRLEVLAVWHARRLPPPFEGRE